MRFCTDNVRTNLTDGAGRRESSMLVAFWGNSHKRGGAGTCAKFLFAFCAENFFEAFLH